MRLLKPLLAGAILLGLAAPALASAQPYDDGGPQYQRDGGGYVHRQNESGYYHGDYSDRGGDRDNTYRDDSYRDNGYHVRGERDYGYRDNGYTRRHWRTHRRWEHRYGW